MQSGEDDDVVNEEGIVEDRDFPRFRSKFLLDKMSHGSPWGSFLSGGLHHSWQTSVILNSAAVALVVSAGAAVSVVVVKQRRHASVNSETEVGTLAMRRVTSSLNGQRSSGGIVVVVVVVVVDIVVLMATGVKKRIALVEVVALGGVGGAKEEEEKELVFKLVKGGKMGMGINGKPASSSE